MSITIKNLNKIYPNGNHALKDVNLEIPTGMFGLLGPNGAGKSTLMRILVALMEPTSGQVEICGYDLMKQRKEIRGILGYLPQDFRFFAKYKTYEFLDYAARLSGMTQNRQRKQAVDEMLENVGLFDVRERYANKLSGGMKRRLGIAQALIHHPKGEFYQFNLSSCIRQQNSLTAQFVSFSLSNLANIFYPPQFLQ